MYSGFVGELAGSGVGQLRLGGRGGRHRKSLLYKASGGVRSPARAVRVRWTGPRNHERSVLYEVKGPDAIDALHRPDRVNPRICERGRNRGSAQPHSSAIAAVNASEVLMQRRATTLCLWNWALRYEGLSRPCRSSVGCRATEYPNFWAQMISAIGRIGTRASSQRESESLLTPIASPSCS